MVVMTTHGYGGLRRLWLGSVADELVRRSDIPLLLVRASDSNGRTCEAAPFQHILVPLDGSRLSEAGLEVAADIAILTGAHVTLVQAVPTMYPAIFDSSPGAAYPLVFPDGIAERVEEEAADYLATKASALGVRGTRARTKVLSAERVADAILVAAKTARADLVVIATHGRGGLARLIIGSVADKVMRGATISVLLVRPAEKYAPPAPDQSKVAALSTIVALGAQPRRTKGRVSGRPVPT